MKYYKYLYCTDDIDKDRVIGKIGRNALQFSVWLLVLPHGEKNQLEIIDSKVLLQPKYPWKDYFVVGLAGSYAKALELVENISREVYDKTGNLKIRDYIEANEAAADEKITDLV